MKYDRFALTADWHWRGKDLPAAEDQLNALIDHAKKAECQAIFMAGDLFDRPNIGDRHASTGTQVTILRDCLSRAEMPIYVVPGNHDKPNEVQRAAFDALEPYIQVLAEPEWILVSGVQVAPLPWIWGGDAEEILDQLLIDAPTTDTPRLLLGHVQVLGARMSGSFLCEHGSFAVSQESIARFPAEHVCLGDFHQRQLLTNCHGGYVGALRQLNHGEEGNPTGFEIWTPATGQVEWVELDAAPRYHTVQWDAHQAQPAIPEGIVRLQTPDWTPTPDEMKDLDVTVVRTSTQSTRQTRLEEEEGSADLRDPIALLHLWAKAQDPTPENLDELETRLKELLAR